MALLEVKDLRDRVEEREILHALSLTVNKGEVHAIMGPNGSGKSTLSHVIAGKPGYEVTGGEILFKGENLLEMPPDERAAKGEFLAFQYPVEIPGVATMTFLRTALNAQRKARGESEFSTPDFLKKVRAVAASLNIPQDMLLLGVIFQAEDGIRDYKVTGVQTCALPICNKFDQQWSMRKTDSTEAEQRRAAT